MSYVWTGASLVYDRHNVYIKIDDFQLAANASRALYRDKRFKRDDITLELAIFNRDILIVGHVPTAALRHEAYLRVAAATTGRRRLINQIDIKQRANDPLQDSWITAKIRSEIFADSDIDPHKFKIVTSEQIVYLMGDVVPEQAAAVIRMARECAGVVRVVTLLKYYHLSDKAAVK